MAQTKLKKIGNSYGVILPADLVREWGVPVGGEISISFDADRLVLVPGKDDHRKRFLESAERVLREHATILKDLAK